MFNLIDRKFKKIGFKKVQEDKHGVTYERQHDNPEYIQKLDLMYKSNGYHIIQSYDPKLMDEKCIGNTGVGITMYEAKLCLAKMKKMGWKIKK